MMADYEDLYQLFNDSALRNRVIVATVVSAHALLAGNPTLNDRAWFAAVMANPRNEGSKAFMAVLAANAGLAIASITGAGDSDILSKVESIRPALVSALAGV
jgi:hypothetical protein